MHDIKNKKHIKNNTIKEIAFEIRVKIINVRKYQK